MTMCSQWRPTSPDETQRAQRWRMIAEAARHLPGVESAAVAGWPLLSMNRWTTTITGGNQGVEPHDEQCLGISPDSSRHSASR